MVIRITVDVDEHRLRETGRPATDAAILATLNALRDDPRLKVSAAAANGYPSAASPTGSASPSFQ